MSFRNDLGSAHENLRRKDEQIAKLEGEKAALQAQLAGEPVPETPAAPGSNKGLPYIVAGLALMTVGMLFGAFYAMRSGDISEVSIPVDGFVREEALLALRSVPLDRCYEPGPEQPFQVEASFGSNGHISIVNVVAPSGLSPHEETCIRVAIVDGAQVPPFAGKGERVTQRFTKPTRPAR